MAELWERLRAEYAQQYQIKHLSPVAYKRTRTWGRIKSNALKQGQRTCQVCGNKNQVHVHRRTSEHQGYETSADLVLLCKKCFRKFKDKLV